ncbi:MAG: tetratricopeptide repeat protein [Proteobacteria bacterium]|nr:tetratricopeptide repeat protein [Pseudomonadota bacterium]
MRIALQHQRAGRQREAEAALEAVLAKRPNDPKALHNLGLARYRAGRHAEAADLIGRAIAIDNDDPAMHTHRALVLQVLGKLKEAEDSARRAIDLKPDYAVGHNNLGIILRARGKLKNAVASYRDALALKPDYLKAHNNLGDVLRKLERFAEAEDSYRQALQLDPDSAEAHSSLGAVLWRLGKLDEAEAALRRAMDLRPNFGRAYDNLGNVLRDLGNLKDAEASLRRAVALRPKSSKSCRNLANVLADQLRLNEAETVYRRAMELDPDDAEPCYSLALLLLLRGEFSEGWALHEERWRTQQMRRYKRKLSKPQWDGGDLKGGTILLHAEQGFGDAIQFVRYASFAASKAGRVILECKPALVDILRTVDGVDEAVARGSDLPPFDVHCPLLSLPHLHGTILETIPERPQYLTPDVEKVSAWAKRLDGPGLKVGLAWAGNPKHLNDRNRSLDARHLQDFAEMGPSFFSLQVGARAADLESLTNRSSITDLAPLLTDYSETAAAIASLDLVICVDTSVAHLAGALGKPVWIMLPYLPDWRWLLEREDSPWYPSAKLYRQETPGDWRPVLDRIRADLRTRSAV